MSDYDPNIINILEVSNIFKPIPTPLETLTKYSITGQSQILREKCSQINL